MSKIKKMYTGIAIFVLYLILPMIINSFLTPINKSGEIDFFIRAILYLLILILFIYVYRKDFKDYYKVLKENKKENIKLTIIYFLLSLFVMFLCSYLVAIIFPSIEYANDDIIIEYFSSTLWFMIFSVVLYTPIVEEIVFRKTFKDIIINKWFYIIFSSIVFAFYHIGYNFNGMESILGMIPYLGLGMVLAFSYLKSKNIYVPIIVHILYDAFVVLINLI